MKYLILIYSNPATRTVWESMSEAERGQGYQAYAALTKELAASGELIATEALADASQTRRIVSSDGPFAEAKEQLAGFYLVECPDMDRAFEIAGRIPEGSYGLLEVRPALDMGGM